MQWLILAVEVPRQALRAYHRTMPGFRLVLGVVLVVAESAAATAQTSLKYGLEPISIRLEGPARVGLPIWVYADLSDSLIARYPFGEDPRYLGSNLLELKRDGLDLPVRAGRRPLEMLVGLVEGSIAPPTSPQNRLPLHLAFDIDRPGSYSVRWTVISTDFPGHGGRPARHQELLAQSNWLDFDVTAPAPGAREAWLNEMLRAAPADPGVYVGDYLPSLLAAAPDGRVAEAIIDATYSGRSLIESCALAGLSLFPADVGMPLTMKAIRERGPSSSIAHFVSWHTTWFQDVRAELVDRAAVWLRSPDDAIVIGALKLLSFSREFYWTDPTPLRHAENAMKRSASVLVRRRDSVAHELAIALGATRDPAVRGLLERIAARQDGASEQARIALKWLDGPAIPVAVRTPRPEFARAAEQLHSTDPVVRRTGADALLAFAQHDVSSRLSVSGYLVNAVIRNPADFDSATWRYAARILGRLRDPAAPWLTLYLERDGVPEVLIEGGDQFVPILTDILKIGGESRRRIAAQVLGAIGGTDAQVALRAAVSREQSPAVKKAIETALSRIEREPQPDGHW